MTASRAKQSGVTLPELLVALFVFALISSVGVYVLRLAVDGREQLTETDDALREWQLARIIIRQDLMQIVDRPVRNEFGETQGGVVIGGIGFSGRTPESGETPLVGFTRAGWANYDPQTPRSTLQYVEYIQKDDRIVRRTRVFLDDARDQPKRDRTLFKGVSDVSFEFLLNEGARGLEWTENWPAGGTRAPRAVRLRFQTDKFGEIEQLFWVGSLAGAGPA